MFIDLANSIIRKNSGNINEGAITTQDTSEQITNTIKEIISGLNTKIERFNLMYPLFQGQVDIIINDINNAIEQKLGNKPVPIVFKKLRPTNLGSYSIDNKVISLNYDVYLVDKIREIQQGTPEEEQRLYLLKDFNNINFDKLDETISHELIHQQQDERSGEKYFNKDKNMATLIKKYDTNKSGTLEDDELYKVSDKDLNNYNKNKNKDYQQKFGEILLNKKIREKFEKYYLDVVPSALPEDIRKEFTKRVEYLNNKAELNTWAKDIVQQYVRDNYNIIINKAKQDKPPSNLSADDIRNTMLAPFINAADTNVFKNQPQQESVQPSQYQQPVQNTQQQQPVQQQQQPVQQQQQPVQQQQQPQKNQELRNKLQQNKNNRDQQQKPTLTQGIKDEQTRILLSYFPEYYLLTSPNKQKWWNYTYQILNKTKFKPFITGQ